MAGNCRCKVALFKSAASQDDSEDRYVKKLNENHFNAMTVPTLSFQFQLEELKKCLSKPEEYSGNLVILLPGYFMLREILMNLYLNFSKGLILTSQRSVECVKEALPNLPVCWDERRHYCVGLQTRDSAAQLLGLSHLIGYDCGNAENLSRLIISGMIYKSVNATQFFTAYYTLYLWVNRISRGKSSSSISVQQFKARHTTSVT